MLSICKTKPDTWYYYLLREPAFHEHLTCKICFVEPFKNNKPDFSSFYIKMFAEYPS
jgi:hypothetical protein